jgi:hypothetical protein
MSGNERLDTLLPPDPGVGRVEPLPAASTAGPVPADLPRHLRDRLAEPPVVGQRSHQAAALVAAAVEWGYDDGQVLALALAHAPTVDKYGTRAYREVARLLGKLRPHHPHIGQPCDRAGCSNRPAWMTSGPEPVTPATGGDTDVLPPKSASGQRKDSPGNRVTQAPVARRVAWTAKELLAMEVPEPTWAVPGLIPAGVTLLAGPPKIGKSWMALGVSIATATGGAALGKVDVEAGDVLYLALEDTPRRLKSRLRMMLPEGDPGPETLTLAIECPPLPQGGDERIAAWLEQHPEARLVVVDVFTRLRGPSQPSPSYRADYEAVATFKTLADQYGVAILLVHHTRKMEAEDFVDAVSGTAGLGAAADAVLVLRRARGKADAVLHVTGRDLQEATYALTFARALGTWELLEGSVDQYTHADTRQKILDHVTEHQGATPKQIADATGLDHGLVKVTVRRMAEERQLNDDGQGHYFPVTLLPEP